MALCDDYDCIVFDCDGVLWTGGETVVGARSTLEALVARGKKVYFMSNNSSRDVGAFRRVFEKHGLGAFVEEDRVLWNSVTATRRWLEGGPPRTCYVVGSPALKAAVAAAGSRVVAGPAAGGGAATDAYAEVELDGAVDAVILGFDAGYGYGEVSYAARCVVELGATLVATNRDFQYPARGGRRLPGNGSFVAAVCAACRREPDVVVAKPSPLAMRAIIKESGVDPRRCLMVGDMWSDTAFGHAAGADAVCVLTGVATAADAAGWDDPPDAVVPDLRSLLEPRPPAPRRRRRLPRPDWTHVGLAFLAGAAIAAAGLRRAA